MISNGTVKEKARGSVGLLYFKYRKSTQSKARSVDKRSFGAELKFKKAPGNY